MLTFRRRKVHRLNGGDRKVKTAHRALISSVYVLLAVVIFGFATQASTQSRVTSPEALIRSGATVEISRHVHVIPDNGVQLVPNVGIIAGSRGTLVVDTGLGPINAQAILREVAKVSRGTELYVVSTHYHPEHAIGEMSFPESATILRARAQQQDIDELGLDSLLRFRSISSLIEELLVGAVYRDADIVFQREHALDLGGVHVRLMAWGATHTRGDTMVFVEDDGVLFAGDVVMNQRFLVFMSPESSVETWLGILNDLLPLELRHIVPSHGQMGDIALIHEQREYLRNLRARVRGHKSEGHSLDEVVEQVTLEMQLNYPNWIGERWIPGAARSAFREAP